MYVVVTTTNVGFITELVECCKLTVFSSKNKPHPNINININGEITNETSNTTFLGVMTDDKLSSKDHILYLLTKLAKGTGRFWKLEDI